MINVCSIREVIRKRSAVLYEGRHKKISASFRRFTEVEGRVNLWFDSMRLANCPFHIHSPLWKQAKLLKNYQYHRMIFKHHGCGLADLRNAEDWNNFFFTVRGLGWTEKTLIFYFFGWCQRGAGNICTVGEACAHSSETAENDVIFGELQHKLCTVMFLRVKISCCFLMCKRKQEMIIIN